MIFLEILIKGSALLALALLILHQLAVQVNEYYFYKRNGWDFSIDSNLYRLKIDERITGYKLGLTNWQRFYLFRPFYIFIMIVLLGFMIWASFQNLPS